MKPSRKFRQQTSFTFMPIPRPTISSQTLEPPMSFKKLYQCARNVSLEKPNEQQSQRSVNHAWGSLCSWGTPHSTINKRIHSGFILNVNIMLRPRQSFKKKGGKCFWHNIHNYAKCCGLDNLSKRNNPKGILTCACVKFSVLLKVVQWDTIRLDIFYIIFFTQMT